MLRYMKETVSELLRMKARVIGGSNYGSCNWSVLYGPSSLCREIIALCLQMSETISDEEDGL